MRTVNIVRGALKRCRRDKMLLVISAIEIISRKCVNPIDNVGISFYNYIILNR